MISSTPLKGARVPAQEDTLSRPNVREKAFMLPPEKVGVLDEIWMGLRDSWKALLLEGRGAFTRTR